MGRDDLLKQYDLRRYTLARLRGHLDRVEKIGCQRLLRRIFDGEEINPDKVTPEERFVLGGMGLSGDLKKINIVLGYEWQPRHLRGIK